MKLLVLFFSMILRLFILPIKLLMEWQIGAGIIYGGIIYGSTTVLFVMFLAIRLFQFFITNPLSDRDYVHGYLASFWVLDTTGWQKLKHAWRFLRTHPFSGVHFLKLSEEERLDKIVLDPEVRNKATLIHAFFEEWGEWPYLEKLEKRKNRIILTLFRPSGYPTIQASKFDTNAFLQAIDLDPARYDVEIENKTKILFTIKELSPQTEIIPFSEVLENTKKWKICLGENVAKGEWKHDDIIPWNNLSRMLIWQPGMGKTSLLISWIIELLEKNPSGSYKFCIWSSKPDMMFFSGFDDVLHCVDSIEWNLKMVEFVLSEIERRKKLFREANVGSILEWNEKFSNARLPLIFLIQDEIADVLKRIELEYEDGATIRKAFERNLRILWTTARSYGIVQYVSLQSSLVSIFWEQWAEFRDTFNILAFNIGRKAVLTSIFGDQQSGADTLEPFHAIYYDKKNREYVTVHTPLFTTADKENFLERNTHRKNKQIGTGIEAYIAYARSVGQLRWKDAEMFHVSMRDYRQLCKDLQASWEVVKLKDNNLVFKKAGQQKNQEEKKAPPSFDNLRKMRKIVKMYQKKTQNTPENTDISQQ